MKVYNGEGMILGRLAAKVAKEALLGEEVKVVNCEKVVISGDKDNTFAREKRRRDRKGYPLKSAKHSRLPERFVRRTVRGMLPWKLARGKEAFKRIKCYPGNPTNVNGVTIEKAKYTKLNKAGYMTVDELCKSLKNKGKPLPRST